MAKINTPQQPAGFMELMALVDFARNADECMERLKALEAERLRLADLYEGKMVFDFREAELERAKQARAEAERLLTKATAECDAIIESAKADVRRREDEFRAKVDETQAALNAHQAKLEALEGSLVATRGDLEAERARLEKVRTQLALENESVAALRAEYTEKAERLRAAMG